MPYSRPTPDELLKRLQAEADILLPGSDARLRHSPEGVITRLTAMASHEHFAYLVWLSRQILVTTCDPEFLFLHADEWGILQKMATQAQGKTKFFGTSGATIPAGTVLRRNDDVTFTLDADVTLASGIGIGDVTAEEWGISGNTSIGSKLSLASPVPGVQTDTIVQDDGSGNGLSGGTDIEDIERLRERVIERKQNRPHGGADFDYVIWAKEVAGVTRAWPYPNRAGRGTMTVICVMDDKIGTIIPSAEEVEDIYNYIESKRPATAELYVIAPAPIEVDFTININPSSLAVKSAIEAEIRAFFKRESVPGGTLYLSRIREAVSVAAGEFDNAVLIPNENVEREFGDLSVVGNFTWGVM
jgi:uncharacterized phage protein gp47/JayE